MSLKPDQIFNFSALHRLQWEDAQQKYVILYPEGIVELNQSSAEILKLCDGTRDLGHMVSELEAKFEAPGLYDDVADFLEAALHNGWIKHVDGMAPPAN